MNSIQQSLRHTATGRTADRVEWKAQSSCGFGAIPRTKLCAHARGLV